MTSEPVEALSRLPLELWSKSKADVTFFHGREGLALQWSLPSVQTSQHLAVKAVLQSIQSGNAKEREFVNEGEAEEDAISDEA